MSEQDIHDIWYEYAVLFVEKKNESEQGWASLNSNEQDIAALWLLEADVFNGGFIQFFCNWGKKYTVTRYGHYITLVRLK